MVRLNRAGSDLAALPGVHAMTDVTGFGLLGHLLEICRASGTNARIDFPALPLLTDLAPYLDAGLSPGGARRNWQSYGHEVAPLDGHARAILCDPQTSGGLLVAVDPAATTEFTTVLAKHDLSARATPVGTILPPSGPCRVTVVT
jgi:selenide,water dikinase